MSDMEPKTREEVLAEFLAAEEAYRVACDEARRLSREETAARNRATEAGRKHKAAAVEFAKEFGLDLAR